MIRSFRFFMPARARARKKIWWNPCSTARSFFREQGFDKSFDATAAALHTAALCRMDRAKVAEGALQVVIDKHIVIFWPAQNFVARFMQPGLDNVPPVFGAAF